MFIWLLVAGCFPIAPSSAPPPDTNAMRQQQAELLIQQQVAIANSLGVKDEKIGERDESGRPVFDGSKVRHPADTPFHCFSLVDGDGNEASQCHEIKHWCANALRKAKDNDLVVTSGCHEVDAVSCYVAYTTGGVLNSAAAFCWESSQDCELMNGRSAYQMGKDNVSSCERVDRMFEPEA